jgi:hypothetical protein
MKKTLLFILMVLTYSLVNAQNTVGTISVIDNVYRGYTLFSIHKKSYLIDNCGRVVKEWNSSFTSGNAVYLLPNGNLLRAGREDGLSSIVFGGIGGVVELFDWDGNVIWQYTYNDDNHRQHHDVYPMPNGNVLILAATVLTNEEAVKAGRNPSITNENLYNEQIIEVEPIGLNNGNIVWEWNVKDHLIQDFDTSKDNFGVVKDNPQKIDVNFLNGGNGSENWLHINSMQYDENLDQIVLSSRNLSEIWIIDHSTTIVESASNKSGVYGKGGDILYRWGNPEAYKQGTSKDRMLFGQHYPHYVRNTGTIYDNKIIVFNNGFGRNPLYSEVNIFTPPTDSLGFYTYNSTKYGPTSVDYNYSSLSSTPSTFYSSIVSSAQVLPNNNILICEGGEGRIFEIDENKNIVWEYVNPVISSGVITSQFDASPVGNTIFRAIKYGLDYEAFIGRNLIVGDPIEKNFNLIQCNNLATNQYVFSQFNVFPNPIENTLNLSVKANKIELYTILGSKIKEYNNTKQINLSEYKSGIYLLKIFLYQKNITRKIIKK